MPEPGCREIETGLAIRERTDDAGPASDLSHDPLEWIVGADLLPMDIRERIVGQCLLRRSVQRVRLPCPSSAAADHRRSPRPFVGRGPALLGMDGLQHVADITNLRRRHVAEDVAVEMHHAALPAAPRQILRDTLGKPAAGVGNDQLDALEARDRPDGAGTPTSLIYPPWRPRRCPESRGNPRN